MVSSIVFFLAMGKSRHFLYLEKSLWGSTWAETLLDNDWSAAPLEKVISTRTLPYDRWSRRAPRLWNIAWKALVALPCSELTLFGPRRALVYDIDTIYHNALAGTIAKNDARFTGSKGIWQDNLALRCGLTVPMRRNDYLLKKVVVTVWCCALVLFCLSESICLKGILRAGWIANY